MNVIYTPMQKPSHVVRSFTFVLSIIFTQTSSKPLWPLKKKSRIQMLTRYSPSNLTKPIQTALMVIKSFSKGCYCASQKNLSTFFTCYKINNPHRVAIKWVIDEVCITRPCKVTSFMNIFTNLTARLTAFLYHISF